MRHTLASCSINYPSRECYKFPAYSSCYSVYSSWTRHLSLEHSDVEFQIQFKCDSCNKCFDFKRAIAAKTHGKAVLPSRASQESGSFTCDYCPKFFPPKRSVAQHIRNRHPKEASEQRADQPAKWESRFWSERECQLFLEALAKFGPASNVRIANHIGTKTGKQIGVHKRIFL